MKAVAAIAPSLAFALPGSAVPASSSSSADLVSSQRCDVADFVLPDALDSAYAAAFGGGGPPGAPPLETFAVVAGLKGGWTPGLKLYETPLVVRFVHLVDVMGWNCAAVYSDGWMDALTKTDPVLRVPSMPAQELLDQGMTEMHTSPHRLLCMVHAWATVVEDWAPESKPSLSGVLSGLGYENVRYGYDELVDEKFDINGTGEVSDLPGLAALASEHCYSPNIMGAIIGRQTTEYARRDGYNMYGDLNRDGTPCEHNCRRYADPTGYRPASRRPPAHHARGKARKIDGTRWRPLEEDDGRGYVVRQEHVTPHIGTLAMPAFLSRAEVDARFAPSPRYDYDREARLVAERLRETALNRNNEKELIEFFDDKIAVTFKVAEAIGAYGPSFEQTLNFVLGLTASEYDATLLAWKAKVENDLVRPTTWIRDEMPDEAFETYGGPFQGVQTIRGKNFDAWVRVMPHSEHVSGSACVCQAVMEYADGWMDGTDGQLAPPGTAPSTYVPGSSIPVPLATDGPGGREPPFLAGSSRKEPGVTPAADVTVVLESMEALRDACGKSRLDGGMHFTDSVPAAYELCDGVGSRGVDFALGLLGESGW